MVVRVVGRGTACCGIWVCDRLSCCFLAVVGCDLIFLWYVSRYLGEDMCICIQIDGEVCPYLFLYLILSMVNLSGSTEVGIR